MQKWFSKHENRSKKEFKEQNSKINNFIDTEKFKKFAKTNLDVQKILNMSKPRKLKGRPFL